MKLVAQGPINEEYDDFGVLRIILRAVKDCQKNPNPRLRRKLFYITLLPNVDYEEAYKKAKNKEQQKRLDFLNSQTVDSLLLAYPEFSQLIQRHINRGIKLNKKEA